MLYKYKRLRVLSLVGKRLNLHRITNTKARQKYQANTSERKLEIDQSQPNCCLTLCQTTFSNSLTIHEESTKKDNTVENVWKLEEEITKIRPAVSLVLSPNSA